MLNTQCSVDVVLNTVAAGSYRFGMLGIFLVHLVQHLVITSAAKACSTKLVERQKQHIGDDIYAENKHWEQDLPLQPFILIVKIAMMRFLMSRS